MALTLDHFMVYPNRKDTKFNFSINKDKRFLYSISHFKENIDKNYDDILNIKKISKYITILLSYFEYLF